FCATHEKGGRCGRLFWISNYGLSLAEMPLAVLAEENRAGLARATDVLRLGNVARVPIIGVILAARGVSAIVSEAFQRGGEHAGGEAVVMEVSAMPAPRHCRRGRGKRDRETGAADHPRCCHHCFSRLL